MYIHTLSPIAQTSLIEQEISNLFDLQRPKLKAFSYFINFDFLGFQFVFSGMVLYIHPWPGVQGEAPPRHVSHMHAIPVPRKVDK